MRDGSSHAALTLALTALARLVHQHRISIHCPSHSIPEKMSPKVSSIARIANPFRPFRVVIEQFFTHVDASHYVVGYPRLNWRGTQIRQRSTSTTVPHPPMKGMKQDTRDSRSYDILNAEQVAEIVMGRVAFQFASLWLLYPHMSPLPQGTPSYLHLLGRSKKYSQYQPKYMTPHRN